MARVTYSRNAQYTPPTPMQLNCRVELRRRCVLNSQLVGDSLDESEQFADNEVELRRVGGVNAATIRTAVASRDPATSRPTPLAAEL